MRKDPKQTGKVQMAFGTILLVATALYQIFWQDNLKFGLVILAINIFLLVVYALVLRFKR